MIRALVYILIAQLTLTQVWAQAPVASDPQAAKSVDVDERLDAQVPLDLTFTDESGKTVTLRDCIASGKPAILQLGYFGCPMLCDLVSQGMLKSLQDLDLQIGRDFSVINMSFDPRETRIEANKKKQTYVQRYARDGAAAGWHFLVGEKDSVKTVADAVGFKYTWVQESQQFAHAAVLMVLTPDGHVSRYLYGVEYPSKTLRLSLVEASEGKIGSTLDKVLMLCFRYDATTGKYTLAAMSLMRLTAVLTLVVLGSFIVRHLLKDKRAQRASGQAA